MIFWDLYGEKGHRVRTTIAEMGPLLLARLMDASEAQEGVLNIAFKIADKGGMPLLDLKDLQALLNYMGENATELSSQFGLIAKASVGSIQRSLLVLGTAGSRTLLRRTGAEDHRHHARQPAGLRADLGARRRQADDEPAPLCDLPALAAFGTVRGIA